MFQNTARSSAVGKELGSVLLGGDGKADGVFRHSDGTVSHKTVKTESRNMQHISRKQNDRVVRHGRRFIRGLRVTVVQLTVFISVDRHFVCHKRIESNDLAFAVPDDLRVGVSP